MYRKRIATLLTNYYHRPLAMNYAYDERAWLVQEEYLFGDDFLIAPCMDEGEVSVKVYFPARSGVWNHLVRSILECMQCISLYLLSPHWSISFV